MKRKEENILKITMLCKEMCNFKTRTVICGLPIEINSKRNKTLSLMKDMMHYIPEDDISCTFSETLEMFYVQDDFTYNLLEEELIDISFNSIVIYRSRTKEKWARRYQMYGFDVVHCSEEPYYVILEQNKIFVIMNHKTVNADRLYFRILREFVLRVKKELGYHLIHAASVAIDEKGILLCGDKGAGKSTLMAHLLRGETTSFIANDKVFVTEAWDRIEYFPLIARIGEGTKNNFEELSLSNTWYRISEDSKNTPKDNLSNDKWEYTPKEIAKAFSCQYISEAPLSAVLFPHISHAESGVKICLRDSGERELSNYDLYEHSSNVFPNWILNTFWQEYLKKQRIKKPYNETNKYKSFELKYTYFDKSQTIIDALKLEI